jgi:(E)-4-hydroxy-3-methylbut-2-enyl-diphosphate synthase
VPVCWDILKSLNLRQRGPTIVACPTCGRIEIDLVPLANKVEEHFQRLGKPLTVAVMGCVVNGPGEASMADVGIAGGKGRGVIFRKGQVVRTVDEKDFLSALIEEGDRVIAEMNGASLASPGEALKKSPLALRQAQDERLPDSAHGEPVEPRTAHSGL